MRLPWFCVTIALLLAMLLSAGRVLSQASGETKNETASADAGIIQGDERYQIVSPKYILAHKWFPVKVRRRDYSIDFRRRPRDIAANCYKLLRNIEVSSSRASINQLFHAMHAFGPAFDIKNDDSDQKTPILDYLQHYYSGNGDGELEKKDLPLWIRSTGNRTYFPIGNCRKVVQDHLDQFLAIMAQSDVSLGTKIMLKDGDFVSLADALRTSMQDYDYGHDPSWTAVVLAIYGQPLAYQNKAGLRYDLVDMFVQCVDVVGGHSICGHFHPLIGATHARQRIMTDFPEQTDLIRFRGADERLGLFCQRLLDNIERSEGVVSPDWLFEKDIGPRSNGELVALNGHALEWLTLYLDDSRLKHPAVEHCVVALCKALICELAHSAGNNLTIDYLDLCHAARGLRIYSERLQRLETDRSESPLR